MHLQERTHQWRWRSTTWWPSSSRQGSSSTGLLWFRGLLWAASFFNALPIQHTTRLQRFSARIPRSICCWSARVGTNDDVSYCCRFFEDVGDEIDDDGRVVILLGGEAGPMGKRAVMWAGERNVASQDDYDYSSIFLVSSEWKLMTVWLLLKWKLLVFSRRRLLMNWFHVYVWLCLCNEWIQRGVNSCFSFLTIEPTSNRVWPNLVFLGNLILYLLNYDSNQSLRGRQVSDRLLFSKCQHRLRWLPIWNIPTGTWANQLFSVSIMWSQSVCFCPVFSDLKSTVFAMLCLRGWIISDVRVFI